MTKNTVSRSVTKISVSVPHALAAELSLLSTRLGVSRSGLISGLLEQAVPDMCALLAVVPESPEASDLIRMRGESESVVRSRISDLQALADATYGEPKA